MAVAIDGLCELVPDTEVVNVNYLLSRLSVWLLYTDRHLLLTSAFLLKCLTLRELVSWSLMSLYSTNRAISGTTNFERT